MYSALAEMLLVKAYSRPPPIAPPLRQSVDEYEYVPAGSS